MPKHFLEDMVRIKHNKDYNPRIKSREMEHLADTEVKYSKNKYRYKLWFVAFFSVIFCFFAFSVLFSKAEVSVILKTKNVVLNEKLSATKDSNDILPFNLMVVSSEDSKIIKASGEKNIKEAATGIVVLYNAFSSSAQKLNVDTRLEGSNGKIYKTQTKTIVPGISKGNIPGSVEVKIYGAEAGTDYNSVPLDFKIFGFKGTPKYSKFYGRSKGPIAGGFIGNVPDISDADKVSAMADLKADLQSKLLQKAIDQVPSGFILYKDAIFLDTDDSNISLTYNEDNNITLTERGTLYGILFNEQKLIQKIAKDNIEKYDNSEFYIPNIKDLTFSLPNKNSISFNSAENINFNLFIFDNSQSLLYL